MKTSVSTERDITAIVCRDRDESLKIIVDHRWYPAADSFTKQTLIIPLCIEVTATVEETAQSHPYGNTTATEYLTDIYDIQISFSIAPTFLSEEEVKDVEEKLKELLFNSYAWEEILFDVYEEERGTNNA